MRPASAATSADPRPPVHPNLHTRFVTRPATSKEAVRRAKALPDPVGIYLARLFRRHASVGVWTHAHHQANMNLDPEHMSDERGFMTRCLRTCVIPNAACGSCGQDTVWPCKDATEALALLEKLEKLAPKG